MGEIRKNIPTILMVESFNMDLLDKQIVRQHEFMLCTAADTLSLRAAEDRTCYRKKRTY